MEETPLTYCYSEKEFEENLEHTIHLYAWVGFLFCLCVLQLFILVTSPMIPRKRPQFHYD